MCFSAGWNAPFCCWGLRLAFYPMLFDTRFSSKISLSRKCALLLGISAFFARWWGTFKKRSMAIFGRSYVCGILFARILPDETSDKKPQRHLRVALITWKLPVSFKTVFGRRLMGRYGSSGSSLPVWCCSSLLKTFYVSKNEILTFFLSWVASASHGSDLILG